MNLVIEPGRAAAHYWRDLWRYRELLSFLAWRDIAVRYKQTAIGVAWALIRPALTHAGVRRVPADGRPAAAARVPDVDPGARGGAAVAVLLDGARRRRRPA